MLAGYIGLIRSTVAGLTVQNHWFGSQIADLAPFLLECSQGGSERHDVTSQNLPKGCLASYHTLTTRVHAILNQRDFKKFQRTSLLLLRVRGWF